MHRSCGKKAHSKCIFDQNPYENVTKWNPPSFFGFDSETVIGDGFTRFANPVSVLLLKQVVSLKQKLEPVSVSTNLHLH